MLSDHDGILCLFFTISVREEKRNDVAEMPTSANDIFYDV